MNQTHKENIPRTLVLLNKSVSNLELIYGQQNNLKSTINIFQLIF